MGNRIDIKKSIIDWAVERSGKGRDFFLREFPKLDSWGEEIKPTLKQIQDFSRKANIPFGYLFLEEPFAEKLPMTDYRTAGNEPVGNPSPELLETIYLMQRRQDWLRSYQIENGGEPLDFVASFSKSDKIDEIEIAKNIRETLKLGCGWSRECKDWNEALKLLNDKIEDVGIVLIFNGIVGNNTSRKLLVKEFRGFVLSDKYAPLIFVNNSDAKAAQMFTVAHELAHLWLSADGGIFNLGKMQSGVKEIEVKCNKIAAEFLVPKSEFLKQWDEYRENFDDIAKHFKVSPIVCAIRALNLKLITKKCFDDFYKRYAEELERRNKKNKGGDFYATQCYKIGKNLSAAIKNAVADGSLLYRDAYNLTGLYGKTFDKYFEEGV
jgi:Zn-dependent peptidase ImmA (M78 family)